MSIPENVWRKAEQNQLRRERIRLIRNGTISNTSVPNVLVKGDGGSWKFPSLKGQQSTAFVVVAQGS